ncbi:hypothetical protein POM88_025688 [Heracleum sosnowskyi]|uniref:Uncharacterized protein n=1 Tax=Heracleum sosnowskyi TaxID=360622 RepID=A0AAD8I5P9_9APIA|nr:hypothetical protein POM88_025688 [Heracleum sosnowskyi]
MSGQTAKYRKIHIDNFLGRVRLSPKIKPRPSQVTDERGQQKENKVLATPRLGFFQKDDIIGDQKQPSFSRTSHKTATVPDLLCSWIVLSLFAGSNDQLSHTFDRTTVKAIILDMIFGAIDTSHTAVIWVSQNS